MTFKFIPTIIPVFSVARFFDFHVDLIEADFQLLPQNLHMRLRHEVHMIARDLVLTDWLLRNSAPTVIYFLCLRGVEKCNLSWIRLRYIISIEVEPFSKAGREFFS